jgi:hypothetical protein
MGSSKAINPAMHFRAVVRPYERGIVYGYMEEGNVT